MSHGVAVYAHVPIEEGGELTIRAWGERAPVQGRVGLRLGSKAQISIPRFHQSDARCYRNEDLLD
jgi:hypothetical protein